MGILDNDDGAFVPDANRRGDVVRGTIMTRARDAGISYPEAVEAFAAMIGRSERTVYNWMSNNPQRPMPYNHYLRLVNAGIIDPKLANRYREPKNE